MDIMRLAPGHFRGILEGVCEKDYNRRMQTAKISHRKSQNHKNHKRFRGESEMLSIYYINSIM